VDLMAAICIPVVIAAPAAAISPTGIKGFVKNEIDGSVYVEAEGEYDQMKEFLKSCKRGTGSCC